MFLSYGKQSINNSDIKSVIKTLKSNYLTQGPEVEKFEAALRKKFNSKYSTVLINGSAAFLLISKILNWKKGDIIAVSPITFLSQINAIEHCNAKPLFIDISMLDYCMDPEKLELEIERLKLEIFELKGELKITKSQLKEASNELQKQQGFYDEDGNYVE